MVSNKWLVIKEDTNKWIGTSPEGTVWIANSGSEMLRHIHRECSEKPTTLTHTQAFIMETFRRNIKSDKGLSARDIKVLTGIENFNTCNVNLGQLYKMGLLHRDSIMPFYYWLSPLGRTKRIKVNPRNRGRCAYRGPLDFTMLNAYYI